MSDFTSSQTTLAIAAFDSKKRKYDNHKDNPHHHGHTIDSAKQELVKAKAKVQELEGLIERLERQDNNTKDADSDSLSPYDDGPLQLQGQTLQSILSFLCPKDVLSCNQVCKQWNQDINSNSQIWKQAAINKSPDFMEHVKTGAIANMKKKAPPSVASLFSGDNADGSEDKDVDDNEDDDTMLHQYYKNIALGLVYQPSTQEYDNDPDKTFISRPKLSPKDIVVLIELNDKESGTIIKTWFKNLDDFAPEYNMVNLDPSDLNDYKVIDRANAEQHVLFTPSTIDQEDVLRDVFFDIAYTIRFFRCDTGQSICWAFDQGFMSWSVHENCGRGRLVVRKRPNAICDAGFFAKGCWWWGLLESMQFYLIHRMSPVLTSYSSEDKATYKIEELCFGFRLNYQPDIFGRVFRRSMDMLLLSLEGLAWK